MNAPSAGEERCTEYFRAFLRSLFTVALEQAKILFPTNQKKLPYLSMAKTLYDFFADGSNRSDFYDTVIRNASPSDSEEIAEIWESFEVLQTYLKSRCHGWPGRSGFCPILISMDEIHVLYDPRNVEIRSPYTLYSRLKSALRGGVSSSFCTIILTTATSVNRIAPSKDVAPSYRERQPDRYLPPPFTELSFDPFMIADPLVPNTIGLDGVGSLEFTAKFGRPM